MAKRKIYTKEGLFRNTGQPFVEISADHYPLHLWRMGDYVKTGQGIEGRINRIRIFNSDELPKYRLTMPSGKNSHWLNENNLFGVVTIKNPSFQYFHPPMEKKEDVIKQYRDLSKKYHPDLHPGSESQYTRIMQDINAEYDLVMREINRGRKFESAEDRKQAEVHDENLRVVIEQLIIIPGIKIEIIGEWIWVSGNTYPVRQMLKEIGMKFSKNKTAWYYHAGEYIKLSKKRYSLEDLRNMFDTYEIDSGARRSHKLKNPTKAQINEMWAMAGQEPELIKNPKEVDAIMVDDLILYAENVEWLYRALVNNYVKNIAVKMVQGKYESAKAVKLLEYYYTNYVRYYIENKDRHVKGLYPTLNAEERKIFAKYFRDKAEEMAKEELEAPGTYFDINDYPQGLKTWLKKQKTTEIRAIKNPASVYKQFNHKPSTKTGTVDIPIEDGLALIGQVTRLDYLSDKQIFAQDKKRGSAPKREYYHEFKRPANVYLTVDRKHLIIKMSVPANSRGIIQ